jgi:hypothetical protein
LEVSLGTRPRGPSAGRGALWGVLIGGGLGFSLGQAVNAGYDCHDDCGITDLLVTGFGLVGGTVVGALLGAAFPGERWERITLVP